jgi:hypothetical protein
MPRAAQGPTRVLCGRRSCLRVLVEALRTELRYLNDYFRAGYNPARPAALTRSALGPHAF